MVSGEKEKKYHLIHIYDQIVYFFCFDDFAIVKQHEHDPLD